MLPSNEAICAMTAAVIDLRLLAPELTSSIRSVGALGAIQAAAWGRRFLSAGLSVSVAPISSVRMMCRVPYRAAEIAAEIAA